MTDFSDLTVLIQGQEKVAGYRERLIDSVVRHFDGCQLVIVDLISEIPAIEKTRMEMRGNTQLSWVQCPDPGSIDHPTKPVQINRQIVGARAGLMYCEREFVLKLRPELYVKSGSHLSAVKAAFTDNALSDKLLCDTITTKDPEVYNGGAAFHVSDWSYFGQKGTLAKLFSCPLATGDDFTGARARVSPESYMITHFVLSESHNANISPQLNIGQQWELMTKHILLLSPNELGLRCQHFQYRYPFGVNGFVGLPSDKFQKIYELYQDREYPLAVHARICPLTWRRNIYYYLYYLPVQAALRMKFATRF